VRWCELPPQCWLHTKATYGMVSSPARGWNRIFAAHLGTRLAPPPPGGGGGLSTHAKKLPKPSLPDTEASCCSAAAWCAASCRPTRRWRAVMRRAGRGRRRGRLSLGRRRCGIVRGTRGHGAPCVHRIPRPERLRPTDSVAALLIWQAIALRGGHDSNVHKHASTVAACVQLPAECGRQRW
jgi:hypothetical protein